MTTLDMIKKLRSETGLSMQVIKDAVNSHQTIEETRAYLKTLRIENTHDMIAKKGVCKVSIKDDIAVIYEVNAMTDFVTSHKAFIEFITHLEGVLLNHPLTPFENILQLPFQGQTVEEARVELEMKISEHVVISRVEYVKKTETQVFGHYQHHNFRSATLVVLESGNETYANQLAKHVAALGALTPKWKQTILEQILSSTIFGAEIMVSSYIEQVDAKLLFTSRFELGETMDQHLSCSLLSKEVCSS
jgi:elongation factor Ts